MISQRLKYIVNRLLKSLGIFFVVQSLVFSQQLKEENIELPNHGKFSQQKEGPTLLGIFPNMHLSLDMVYTTGYISRGSLSAHESFQSNLFLEVNNPWINSCWDPKLYFIYFANTPLVDNDISSEIDYSLGASLHVANTYWHSPVIFDVGYSYYTFPLSGVRYNRSNNTFVGVEIHWPLVQSNLYVYYNFNLKRVVAEGRLIYEKKLKDIVNCAGERWDIQLTGLVGYWNAQAANGDQIKENMYQSQNGYAYAGIIGLLSYRLNEYAKIGTGFTWAINNDGIRNIGGHENVIVWNAVSFSIEY